jgi:Phage integrase, N-terminal SAM-like domain
VSDGLRLNLPAVIGEPVESFTPPGAHLPTPAQADSDAELISIWLARSESPNTRRAYARLAERFLAFVRKPLAQVRVGDLQRFLALGDGPHAPGSLADLASASRAQAAAAIKSLSPGCGCGCLQANAIVRAHAFLAPSREHRNAAARLQADLCPRSRPSSCFSTFSEPTDGSALNAAPSKEPVGFRRGGRLRSPPPVPISSYSRAVQASPPR